jgi:hypothetical protein
VDTLGTLVLSMWLNLPSTENKGRCKTVVLARYHHLSRDDARLMKEVFLKENQHIKPSAVDGQWIVREYI